MKKKYFTLIALIVVGIGFQLLHSSQPKNKARSALVIAFDAKIISGDPRMIGSDPGSQYIEELRFLPLISFDKDGNMRKVLAESIQYQEHNLIITLKKGVHFGNGDEITSFDVESTYKAIMTARDGFPLSPRKGGFINVSNISVQDPYTIVFSLQNKDVTFVNNLMIGILPKNVVESEPIGNLAGKHYESGPFCLESTDENSWHFEANQLFDYANPPKLQKFTIKIIPDSTTRYAALMKGDIDLIQNSLDPDKINVLETKMPNAFKVHKGQKLAVTYIGFNFKDPILKHKAVREALSYALDTKSILKYRLRSDELPANGMFPENSLYFHRNLSFSEYQLNNAKSLLESSGLKLPIVLTLTVSSSNKTNLEIAKTMAVGLREVGFQINVKTLENSVFLQHLNRGLVQMWLAPWIGFKDPDHLRFIFSSTMVPPYGANRGHYANPEVDALLEEGRLELDPEKRKNIYLKAQELLAKDMPYLFLWHGTNVAVTSNRVEGFEVYADGRYWSLVNTTVLDQ